MGIHDNFFELGASSLDAIHITNLLKERLERNIPIVTLFTYPTIALLASHLANGADDIAEDTEQQEALVEGRQLIESRRLRRLQEDEE